MSPGIAGLAQVKGRSDLTFDETATYFFATWIYHSVQTDLSFLLARSSGWRLMWRQMTARTPQSPGGSSEETTRAPPAQVLESWFIALPMQRH